MPKIISKARQLRMQYQVKEGRDVPISEVAEKTGIDRKALARLESGKTERYDEEILVKLCAFYGVGVGDILEYDPNNRRAFDLGAAVGALP